MKKNEQERQEKSFAKDIVKILFLMYIITTLLLLLLAFLLFKTEMPKMAVKVWLSAVYAISGFLGGFLIGKRRKSKRFLWGLLTGSFYFMILFAVSLIMYKGLPADWVHLAATMALCIASAAAGGMVS